MKHQFTRRHCLVLATMGGLAQSTAHARDPMPPTVGPGTSPQSEIASQLSVPQPPQGVTDVQWRELAPAGWSPYIAMARAGLEKLQPNDIRGAVKMSKVRKEWDRAAPVRKYDGQRVRLTGYPAILNPDEGSNAVLLAPYDGLARGTPAPPANQMAVVILEGFMPPDAVGKPVWVLGTLRVQRVTTPYGIAGYAMQGAQWKPYPSREHPITPYTLRW